MAYSIKFNALGKIFALGEQERCACVTAQPAVAELRQVLERFTDKAQHRDATRLAYANLGRSDPRSADSTSTLRRARLL